MSDWPYAPQAYEALLTALGPDAVVKDRFTPDNPVGEHWLDLYLDGYEVNVPYRREHGFGIYIGRESFFGTNPDEIVRDPAQAAWRLREVVASWKAHPDSEPDVPSPANVVAR